MTEDQVGFATNQARDRDIDEAKEILQKAAGEPDLFNDWENDFISSSLEQMAKFGYGFKLSSARREAVDRIKAKLEKEGLVP